MSDNLRIGIDELKKRVQAGEDIIFIDTRNPQAWAQSDVMLPKAIRVPVDHVDKHVYEIPKDRTIVAYCT